MVYTTGFKSCCICYLIHQEIGPGTPDLSSLVLISVIGN